jgi:hypothetical protein
VHFENVAAENPIIASGTPLAWGVCRQQVSSWRFASLVFFVQPKLRYRTFSQTRMIFHLEKEVRQPIDRRWLIAQSQRHTIIAFLEVPRI